MKDRASERFRECGLKRKVFRRLAGAAICVLAVAAVACAPRPYPGPGAETQPMGTTPRLAESHLVVADGTRLPLRRWMPEDPPGVIIAALHGFNDYSNAFREPARFWAGQGIGTYAIDQRGFGETAHPGLWPGTATLVDDADSLVRAIQHRHPGLPVVLLGESMGGAVAMILLGREDAPPLSGAVLVAPAVWGRAHLGPVRSGLLWLAAHTVPWLALRPSELDITPSDNLEMLRRLAADPLVIRNTRVDAVYGLVGLMDRALAVAGEADIPTLMAYGIHEEVIPPDATREAARRIRESDGIVAVYPSGYHMLLRDLEAETVWRDIAAWVKSPGSGSLPSGAQEHGNDWLEGTKKARRQPPE